MSYTNQTQHYGLPQYVGTDVPAWLTDVNGAFATIDQGMNAAKTQADTAGATAGQAANDITSINSTLRTQATQISAAAQAAASAQTTANNADSKADNLETRVTSLETSREFIIVEIPFTGALATEYGFSYVSAIINYQHPQGYLKADIISAEFVGNVGAFVLLDDAGMYLVRPSANNNATGTVRIYYLKKA